MMRLFIYLFFFIPACCLHAQSFEWALRFGGSTFYDRGYAIRADQQGNVLTAGSFQSIGNMEGGQVFSNGGKDVFIYKVDSKGQLMWLRSLGSTGADEALALDTDAQGNVYVTGQFTGTVDFDPGVGAFNMTANGGETFILKLSPAGTFIWAKQVVNITYYSDGKGNGLRIGANGHVYVTGVFSSTVDLDPGPGVHQVPTNGGVDFYVLQLDPDGNFVWARNWGYTGADFSYGIAIDKLQQVYVTGYFTNQIDADPGPGVAWLDGIIMQDLFLIKLDADGNFLWADAYGKVRTDVGKTVDVDPFGNVVVAGSTEEIGAPNAEQIFIRKWSPQGVIQWTKIFGDVEEDDHVNSLSIDRNGYIYLTGVFEAPMDFDPGPGTATLSTTGSDIFMLRLYPDGTYSNAISFPSIGFEVPYSIDTDDNGYIYMSGVHDGCDFDPGPGVFNLVSAGTGNEDVFTLKLSQLYDVSGRVFFDANNNLTEDPGEFGIRNALIENVSTGQLYNTFENGNFRIFENITGDTLRVLPPVDYWTVTPAFSVPDSSHSVLLFAVQSEQQDVRDVRISVTADATFRPGFTTELWIQVENLPGSLPVDTVPVEVIPQALLPGIRPEWVSADVTPEVIYDSLWRWQIGPLGYGEIKTIRCKLRIPVSAPLGTPVLFSSSTPVTNDFNDSDNGVRTSDIVRGSCDPNDKNVFPWVVAPEKIDTTSLRYVIRFQNTGNFPTSFVTLLDTLPDNLDVSTLQVLGASHPYSWRLLASNILEVRFDPLFLQDSLTNEPASKGFFSFSIRARSGLQLGDQILNRAAIYFDYNAPVITAYSSMSVAPEISGQTHPAAGLSFQVYPNPVVSGSVLRCIFSENTADIRLLDVYGRQQQYWQAIGSDMPLQLPDLPAGLYWLRVQAGTRQAVRMILLH